MCSGANLRGSAADEPEGAERSEGMSSEPQRACESIVRWPNPVLPTIRPIKHCSTIGLFVVHVESVN